MGKLGDILARDIDPIEAYYDQYRQGVKLPRRPWIVKPEFVPPAIPSLADFQKMFEQHILPRQWQQLADLWVRLQCGTYFVKAPNWIEPPLSARPLDLRTDDAGVSIAAVTATDVLTYTVPDRVVGTLKKFGHGVCPFVGWDNLLWTISVNEVPIPGYTDFRQQIGPMGAPVDFPSPTILPHKAVLKVTARLSAAGPAVTAYARAVGFTYPVREISQVGDAAQYHVAH